MFSFSVFKHVIKSQKQWIRCKHSPDHWSVVRKKKQPVDKALAHFDDFYQQVFTKDWESIREGLLSKQKYVAVVNNYGDNEETMSTFERQGALNIRTLFNVTKQNSSEKRKRKERRDSIRKAQESEDSTNEVVEEPKKDFSLKGSLERAEIDHRRIIDVNSTLSAEILHEHVPATRIKGKEDFIPESTHYGYYKSDDFQVEVEKEYDLHFPEHLNVYCFEEGNTSEFEPSKMATTSVLNYYLMDGGSILPVLALDTRPGDRVLDICAAPGGKSLLVIQTLYPNCVVSNDVSVSRTRRIKNVAKQFLYDLNEKWLDPGKLQITNVDGRFFKGDHFDRVLVDVPCTTDRHSLRENDNNIFKPSRVKERLQIPEIQCELLVNAMKLVKKGGVVVYSTCSLSPIQNDGVVHMALKQLWEETKIEMTVQDLSLALAQGKHVYKMCNQKLMKYGHLVVPHLEQNYGPTYFCKLKRVK